MTHADFTVTTTAVQVFSGTGRVKVMAISSGAALGGDNTVTLSNGFTMATNAVHEFSFEQPSEIWAISGSSTPVRVVKWY